MKILLFTSDKCANCKPAKEYLIKNKIKFEEINVWPETKEKNKLIIQYQVYTLPTLVFKNEVYTGFSIGAYDKIKKLYNEYKK